MIRIDDMHYITCRMTTSVFDEYDDVLDQQLARPTATAPPDPTLEGNASVELGSIHHAVNEAEAVPAGANLCAVGLPLSDIHRGIAELQHGGGGLLGCNRECERSQHDGQGDRGTG